MTNLRHYYEAGVVYFITSVTRDRIPLFLDTAACRFLLTCMEYQKQILGCKIYGFVVMPEHLHCVIQAGLDYGIPKIMNALKGNFARKYNALRKCSGVVWQEGYYESGLRTMTQLLDKITYMHNNPVRAGLVASASRYEFSSFQFYYGTLYKNLIDTLR